MPQPLIDRLFSKTWRHFASPIKGSQLFFSIDFTSQLMSPLWLPPVMIDWQLANLPCFSRSVCGAAGAGGCTLSRLCCQRSIVPLALSPYLSLQLIPCVIFAPGLKTVENVKFLLLMSIKGRKPCKEFQIRQRAFPWGQIDLLCMGGGYLYAQRMHLRHIADFLGCFIDLSSIYMPRDHLWIILLSLSAIGYHPNWLSLEKSLRGIRWLWSAS